MSQTCLFQKDHSCNFLQPDVPSPTPTKLLQLTIEDVLKTCFLQGCVIASAAMRGDEEQVMRRE